MMRRLLVLLMVTQLAGCGAFSRFFSTSIPHDPVELTPFTATLGVKLLWRAGVSGAQGYFFSPALAGPNVYVAGGDGTVESLSIVTGAKVWSMNVGDKLAAGVGADPGTIAVATVGGDIIALGLDGKPRFRVRTGGEVLSAPAVGDGVIVARTTDGRLLAFDSETGERRWVYTRPSEPLVLRTPSGMIISGGVLYAGLAGGRLVALSTSNGAVRWEIPVAFPKGATELERVTDVVGTPSLAGGEICAASFQGRAGCFDADRGNLSWARDISTSSGLGVDPTNAYVTDEKSVVQALSRVSGASVWKNSQLLYRQAGVPIPVGAAVVVGDYKGFVHWLSRDTGKLMARMSTDGSPIEVAPVVLDALPEPAILVQTRDGGLFAFGQT